MPRIQIINRTRRIRDARFAFMLPGMQQHVSLHFAPKWGVDAVLQLVGKAQAHDPSAWKLWLFDNSDEADALGYHDVDAHGVPQSKIFVEDDIRSGSEITVTASHELGEMLADPYINRLSPRMADGYRYAVEPYDPVEQDEDGYMAGPTGQQVVVSNFACPAYYGLPNADGSADLDYRGLLFDPCPVMRPGGYLLRVDDAGRWTSTMARYEDGKLSHRAVRYDGRSSRRAAQPAPPP